jgi:predicted TIM-barrel fold metal-dependent hydrolase
MDLEGTDVAVLYPSQGLFALAFDTLDPDLGYAVARAYNDWMHDFFSVAPERMYGAAMISPFDVNTAIDETRRGVEELGTKGVFIRPNVVNGRNWHDPYYDPLWAEIESLGVPLAFHEGSNAPMQ